MTQFHIESIRVYPEVSALDAEITILIQYSVERDDTLPHWWEAVFTTDIAGRQKRKSLVCTPSTKKTTELHIDGLSFLTAVDSLDLQNIALLELYLRKRSEIIAKVGLVVQISKYGNKQWRKTILPPKKECTSS